MQGKAQRQIKCDTHWNNSDNPEKIHEGKLRTQKSLNERTTDPTGPRNMGSSPILRRSNRSAYQIK